MNTSRSKSCFTYSSNTFTFCYFGSNLTPVSIQWIVNLRCPDGTNNKRCLLPLSLTVIIPPFHRFLPPIFFRVKSSVWCRCVGEARDRSKSGSDVAGTKTGPVKPRGLARLRECFLSSVLSLFRLPRDFLHRKPMRTWVTTAKRSSSQAILINL